MSTIYSCTLANVTQSACEGLMGGYTNLYVAEFSDVDWSSVTPNSDGEITALTMAGGATFKKIDGVARAGTGFNDDGQKDGVAAPMIHTSTITAVFTTITVAMKKAIDGLACCKLVAVLEDYNGNYFFYGVKYVNSKFIPSIQPLQLTSNVADGADNQTAFTKTLTLTCANDAQPIMSGAGSGLDMENYV